MSWEACEVTCSLLSHGVWEEGASMSLESAQETGILAFVPVCFMEGIQTWEKLELDEQNYLWIFHEQTMPRYGKGE